MNIKIKKKILVCMLWLCAIACFTGFPWIFFSWDVIHSYMGIHDIPSDLTIVLFREECLFFGFFCIYFLFLRNIEKYKGLISFCSFLVAFMGGFMYLLKLQTGIVHISSDYEPFIWLIIGSFIFYLNHSINGIAPKKTKTSRFKLFIPSAGRSIAIEHCKYFSPRTDLENNVQYFLFYSFTL